MALSAIQREAQSTPHPGRARSGEALSGRLLNSRDGSHRTCAIRRRGLRPTQPGDIGKAVFNQWESEMRNFSNTRTKLGSVAVVASLALAAPMVASGTAHAAVKVTVSGTVSCAKFGDSTPSIVTITPRKGNAASDELPGEDEAEPYSIVLTGIPANGTKATAVITCVDSDNEQNTITKTFAVKKPADGSPVTRDFG
ncbi:hypothetical protein AB0I68_13760 [Streptomyces sp. NPDC050448]|uniref:hypothetical protein n=1 Tax=Streptomyces sp. NPDC050448 TaxID=3155404 RepID=UPI003449F235